MKNYTFIAYLYLLIIACSGGREKSGGEDASTESAQPISEVGDAGRQDTTLEPIPFAKDTSNWPAFIKNPTLTTVQLGDTTIVLSRPFIHKNNTAEKDAERIARDQIIKARIEKMTSKYPDWYLNLTLNPNFWMDESCFLLFDKDKRPHVYFENSNTLMDVDQKVSRIYPKTASFKNQNEFLRTISVSDKESTELLQQIRVNPHIPNKKDIKIIERIFWRPEVSGNIANLDQIHVNYKNIFYSDDWIVGGQGGTFVFNKKGELIFHHTDEKDVLQYVTIINEEFFATISYADGWEGCNQCLPFVVKVIHKSSNEVIHEEVFHRDADISKSLDDVVEVYPNPVDDMFVFRVEKSFPFEIAFYAVELKKDPEVLVYPIKPKKKDFNLYKHEIQAVNQAFRERNNGNSGSLKRIGFLKK